MSSLPVRPAGTLVALALLVLTLVAAPQAFAQICGFSTDKAPARPADESLWGGLEPLETKIDSERDSTSFTRNTAYTLGDPLYRMVEIEDNRLFAAFNLGVKTWEIKSDGTLGKSHTLSVAYPSNDVPIKNFNPHDYFRVKDVDVTDDGELMTMTGIGAMGMTVWRVRDKDGNRQNPRLIYQDGHDSGKNGEDVYVTEINGVRYGFLASWKSSEARGLHAYNLDQALSIAGPNDVACTEMLPVETNCAGVRVARMTDVDTTYVDGAGNDSIGHILVSSGGNRGRGLSVWSVSNPGSPKLLFTDLDDRLVQGLKMWERNSRLYLALTVRDPDEARIYDVSCLRNGGTCSGDLPGPIYRFSLPGWATSATPLISYSESNGTPYLYIGATNVSNISVLQAEWLLDVSDPGNPLDVLGGDPTLGGEGQPTINHQGVEVGYWSWYYSCHPSGSNFIEPGGGMVHNGYLYRAATSILDIHKVGETKPRILVSSQDQEGYEGDEIRFTAQALNCQPASNGWTWSATGGGQTASTSAVADVVWTDSGNYSVSAANTGCPGAEVDVADVKVLDAEPFISALAPNVSQALSCSPVTFTASGVTGRPPLDGQWEILDPLGAPLASPTLSVAADGLSAVWDTAEDLPLTDGAYKARLTMINGTVDAVKTSSAVGITNPGDLAFTDPIGAAVSFGTVQFAANATGATEWRWDFGDGNILETEDPVLGPAPEHVYDAVGTYPVTVSIRNCVDTAWQTSTVKQVEIIEINPLIIESFQALGGWGSYIYDTGSPISFSTVVSGDPEFWDYDWDGNGTFEDANNTSEVTSHTYNQAGSYQPVLRVRRGTAEKVFQHVQVLEVSAANREIAISAPGSGDTDDAITFRATASGCSPAANGWAWTASGGGNVIGGGSSVQISWSTAGTKRVTATNSACGSTTDSHSIVIRQPSSGGGGGGGGGGGSATLDAAFSFSPSSPDAGEVVTFNASASDGNPTSYTWTIEGQTLRGERVDYTFTEAGSYQVQLEIGKAGNECSFTFCTDTLTKTVNVKAVGPVVGSNGCSGDLADDRELLCLKEGRFEIEVDWRNQHGGGKTGPGIARRYEGSDVTGFFWFFNPNNVELIVKVLETPEGDHWVFYGGLSDVYYKLTVTDTETNKARSYENPESSICGTADTGAFIAADSELGGLKPGTEGALHFPAAGVGTVHEAFRPGLDSGGEDEEEPSETLSLLGGRFEVTVDWVNQHANNATGVGTAIPGTDQSGYFWFFNERNLELVVKMVDGRESNGYWWVFWGGLTDVNYNLKVVDVITGREWIRTNPANNYCGGSDTAAFAAD